MKIFATLNLFLFSCVLEINCANFLFLNGESSPSHHIWNRALMEGLAANKDHNLTIVSVHIDKKTHPNMHYTHLERAYDAIHAGANNVNILLTSKEKSYETTINYYKYDRLNCQGILQSEGLNTILNYPDDFKFDAVIFDFTCGPCLLPLLHKFKYPPLIALSPFNNPPFTDDLVGGHQFPAYIPYFALTYSSKMDFFQRIHNTILFKFDEFYRRYVSLPNMENMVKDRFGFSDMPSLQELERRTVLMLINNDASLDFPEPLVPNIVKVGGLQIVDPKPLPDDLKKFIESGKKGTVLMSLGTNMRSDMLGKQTLINILTTFRELPQYNFLWKFESDELPIEKSENVKILKFLPQNSILAHPHLKAFITHAGLLSTQESLWYGKPMVGIPIFGDQHMNIERSINYGTAEKLCYQTLTVKDFKETILRVLENPIYTENAQVISKRFRDQPEKPLNRAIWWIEYILRNPEPQHLISPKLQLGWFVANSYDIMLFFILILILIFYLVKIFLSKLQKFSEFKLKIKEN